MQRSAPAQPTWSQMPRISYVLCVHVMGRVCALQIVGPRGAQSCAAEPSSDRLLAGRRRRRRCLRSAAQHLPARHRPGQPDGVLDAESGCAQDRNVRPSLPAPACPALVPPAFACAELIVCNPMFWPNFRPLIGVGTRTAVPSFVQARLCTCSLASSSSLNVSRHLASCVYRVQGGQKRRRVVGRRPRERGLTPHDAGAMPSR